MSTGKNTAYNVGYRVFSVLLPLVTAPYLSRTVGTHGVGLYSYAWNISYFACLAAMLGLENYGTRAIAAVRDDRGALDRTFSAIWRMQRAVALAVLALWLGYILFIAGEEKDIAVPLTLMSVSCLFNLDWALMGLDSFRPIALRNTAVKLIAAASVFILIRSEDDLWIYGFAWSLATCVGNLTAALSLRGKVTLVRVSRAEALRHLGPCSLLFLSVLATSVYRVMDKVMVGAIAGKDENGLYENAEKIVYCLSGFISAVGTVMLPKISNLWRKGETARIRRHLDATMQGIMLMTGAMAFGLAAVADRFSVLFYGEAFAGSGPLMIPLGFSLMFIGFANVIRTQWILPQERDRIVVRSVCSGAVINVAANALLIPGMGAMGAVIGTLLAEFTVPFVQWLHLRRELPYGDLLLHALAASACGAVMFTAVRLAGLFLPATWPGLAGQVAVGLLAEGALCLPLLRLTGSPLLRVLRPRHPSSN